MRKNQGSAEGEPLDKEHNWQHDGNIPDQYGYADLCNPGIGKNGGIS